MDAVMEPAPLPEVHFDNDAADSVLRNPDILRLLFSQLVMEDLCRAGATCRQWRAVSQSDEFWSTVDFTRRLIRQDQVLGIVKRHPNVKSLNLMGVTYTPQFLQGVLSHLNKLQHLTLGGGTLTEAELLQINSTLSTLQQCTICDAIMCRSSVTENLLAHSTLPKLHLSKCRGGRLAVRCCALRELVVKGCAFSTLVIHSPALHSLDLRDSQKISDVALRSTLTHLTSLRSLDLSYIVPLSDDTLREVGLACINLTSLKAAGCPGLTLNSVAGFPALRELDLSGCDCIAPATALPALERWTTLEQLVLDQCGLLTHLSLSLPRLRTVSLRHCRALANVDLKCAWLEHLDVGSDGAVLTRRGRMREAQGGVPFGLAMPDAVRILPWVHNPVLRRVVLSSDAMTRLTLSSCPSLQELVLDCPFLRDVEFVACGMLTDSTLQTLSTTWLGQAPAAFPAGGSPGCCSRLRVVRLHNCGGLSHAMLSNNSLEQLNFSACRGLRQLSLCCPNLHILQLEECNDLLMVDVLAIGMETLSLGTCPHLTSLKLRAPILQTLDLRGCGMLNALTLDCPKLHSLDATFCGRLAGPALALALSGRPPLRSVVLSVCSKVDADALSALINLPHLTLLDLSYTEVKHLEAVFTGCSTLQTLRLSSCAYLEDDALMPLLPPCPRPADSDVPGPIWARGNRHRMQALPQLRELDISYCPLPTSMLANILARATHLNMLAINGCPGATRELWEGAHAVGAPALALRSLSAVGCKKLRACWLGMVPAAQGDLDRQEHLLQVGMYSPPASCDTAWREVPVSLSGLRVMRLGLSGVRSLALALPELASLDVNNVAELRCLELRTPVLLTACVQACKMLPPPMLERAFLHCPALEALDAQHSEVPLGAPSRLLEACPALKTLLVQHKGQALQGQPAARRDSGGSSPEADD